MSEVKDEIAEILEQIRKENGGVLRPDDVVSYAKKHKKSALGARFTWNVQDAAYQHWLWQARKVIAACRTSIITETVVVSAVAYVQDPDKKKESDQGYTSVHELRDDEDRARRYLAKEFTRIGGSIARLRETAELIGMEKPVAQFERQIGLFRAQVEGHA